MPAVLFLMFTTLWVVYARTKFRLGIQWTTLELRIPREIRKMPKAMEQVFAGIYSLRNVPSKFYERYIEGEMTLWFSFEIVSFSGDTHIYVRVPTKRRGVVEAMIYAQYSDIEIVEIPDYMPTIPPTYDKILESGYEMWGTELQLAKEDAYPIRTYEDFRSTVEEEQLDPVSTLFETFGRMKRGEKLYLQLLIRPTGDEWVGEGRTLVNKLKTSNVQKKTRIRPTGETEEFEQLIARTPGEIDLLKAIDRNISKPGFETVIRYLYMAPKEIFSSDFPGRGVLSCFNQYATMSMNLFKHNSKVRTLTRPIDFPYFFTAKRLEYRKKKLLRKFRERRMPEQPIFILHTGKRPFVLNTEELATVYHPPTHLVMTAPLIKRVESRKMGAPAGLAMYGPGEQSSPWEEK